MSARQEEPYGPLRRDVRLLGSLLGRVLVEQEGEAFLAAEERIRRSARRVARGRRPGGRPRRRARARPRTSRRGCCAPSPSTSSSRTRPSSTTGCGGGARTRAEVGTPRESLAEAFERLDGRARGRAARGVCEHVSLELVLTAHPTEATRRTLLRAHVRIAELLTRARRPRADRGRAGASSRTSFSRRSRSSGRPTRCGPTGRASATRSATASGSSRRACSTRASGCCRSTAGSFRPSRVAVLVRQLDRRRPRRQPGGQRRDDHGGARAGARDGAGAVPGRRAGAPDRARLEPVARRRLGRAGGVDRARRARVRRLPRRRGPDDDDASGTGGSSRTCGGGSRTTPTRARRSCSTTSPWCGGAWRRTAATGSPRGALARFARRVELFGFHVAKLDVRLHASEVRAPTERTRGVFDAVAAVRARHGSRALDTVIVSATTSVEDVLARARPHGRAGRRRPAVRDDRRPRPRRQTRCAHCSPTRATACGSPSAAGGSR